MPVLAMISATQDPASEWLGLPSGHGAAAGKMPIQDFHPATAAHAVDAGFTSAPLKGKLYGSGSLMKMQLQPARRSSVSSFLSSTGSEGAAANSSSSSSYYSTVPSVSFRPRARQTAFLTKEDMEKIACTSKSIPNAALSHLDKERDYEEVYIPIDSLAPAKAAGKIDEQLVKLFDSGLADQLSKVHGPFEMVKVWLAAPKEWPAEILPEDRKPGVALMFRESGLKKAAKLSEMDGAMQVTKEAEHAAYGPAVRTYFHKARVGALGYPGLGGGSGAGARRAAATTWKTGAEEETGRGVRAYGEAAAVRADSAARAEMPKQRGLQDDDVDGKAVCVADCGKFSSKKECNQAASEVYPPVAACKWYDAEGGHCGPIDAKLDAEQQKSAKAKKAGADKLHEEDGAALEKAKEADAADEAAEVTAADDEDKEASNEASVRAAEVAEKAKNADEE
eukprot:CAMPEP_0178993262 /NCGR_PEP_ID=MMETSP0795-20121207/6607_1 /TAXON_ID=88552 /ORGANISM="Amoebophrya sp., Strain Ameob2" /LENGTH=449 /DNA_ID=CAMNT_0020685305 /DNA_START=104 /DNA_END=1455 /DNA_ORIENTATION=-